MLNQAEQYYSTIHKEALAVVWALRHFKDLIYGYPIHVKTDHAAVVELFNQKHLSGKLTRWSLIIQDFNPTFAYLPGKANVVADALSRCIGALQISGGDEFRTSLMHAQRDDSFCIPLIYLESGDDTQLPRLPIPKAEFSLNYDILIRTTYLELKHEPHREVSQMVIPESLVSTIVEALHSAPHAGHPGKDICLHQARLEYYWPTMRKDIHSYVDKCHTCAVNKGSVGRPVKILSYPTPLEPWDTLAIDLLKLPTSRKGLF